MKNFIMIRANVKRHKAMMIAIYVIVLIVSLTLVSILSIWLNANDYLMREMDRMHYGDITAWTQDVEHPDELRIELEEIAEVKTALVQPLIYSNYQVGEVEADSEGQLIVHQPEQFPYRFFQDSMDGYASDINIIHAGEVYISPSILDTFSLSIGDEISFPIARGDITKTLTVKGLYEDPFMGSSMIGMKGFLISQQDYDEIQEIIMQAGINALARTGQMFHIEQREQSEVSNQAFSQLLNEQSDLPTYTVFAHSKDAIADFMLILQNVYTGLFLCFAAVLFIVSMIVVGYSIGVSIDQDKKDMAILKTLGYTGNILRRNIKIQYIVLLLIGIVSGILLSILCIPIVSKSMVSFSGMLVPSTIRFSICFVLLCIIPILFYGFIHIKTKRIENIPPIMLMQEERNGKNKKAWGSLQGKHLVLRISFRQLMDGKRYYRSVLATSVLLVLFTSMIGRINTWLGPNGEGMMDAFNPADLDVGVQLLGSNSIEEMEAMVQQYSSIEDSYALAMLGVVVDGVDYTANIITEPDHFHMQQGTSAYRDDEVVITETIAKDRNLQVNDQITIAYNGNSASYRIVGIYQCANDMGANIGMNREGFLRIGNETSEMWCYHYLLDHPEQKGALINALNVAYGGDVYIHENTWPGLISILSAMDALLLVMYIISTLFIFVVTYLTVQKIFLFERRNLLIYKAIGFSVQQLRMSFAIRYGIVTCIGAGIGTFLSYIGTDYVIGSLMNLYGISNFASHPGVLSMLLPGSLICALFVMFAYATSRCIKKLDVNELTVE